MKSPFINDVIEYLNKLLDSDYLSQDFEKSNLIKLLRNDKDFSKYYIANFSKYKHFRSYINKNIKNPNIINPYTNQKEKVYNIDQQFLKNKINIKILFSYFNNDTDKQKQILINHHYNNCNLFGKLKTGNINEPNNYRYMTNHHNFIKIVDRIFIDILCYILTAKNINKCIPIEYFKVILFNNKLSNLDTCSILATENTQSKNRVLCIDIKKAFDSVEWKILYDSMINSLSRVMSNKLAIAFTNFYFIILQNRNFTYKNNKIFVKKGISQGLPSSCLIFSIFMSDIIYKIKYELRNELKLNIDNHMRLNIYVDDIFCKFYNYSEQNNKIINKLIEILESYRLYINNNKSFGDLKLELDFKYQEITNQNMYLGIPFTRNIKEYFECIMDDFKNKKIKEINELNIICTWLNFYHIILSFAQNNTKDLTKYKQYKIITGFLRYKLTPLICNFNYNIKKTINNNDLKSFFEQYYKIFITIINFINYMHYYIFVNYIFLNILIFVNKCSDILSFI